MLVITSHVPTCVSQQLLTPLSAPHKATQGRENTADTPDVARIRLSSFFQQKPCEKHWTSTPRPCEDVGKEQLMDSSGSQQLLATNPNLLHLPGKHWGGQNTLSSPFPPLVPQKKPCGNTDGEFPVCQPSIPLPAHIAWVPDCP